MSQSYHFTITSPEETGKRIDVFCGERFAPISRSQWKKYGRFYCNGKEVAPHTLTELHQTWEVVYAPEKESALLLEDYSLPDIRLLAEGPQWAVIHKPAGLKVHPVPGKKELTLVDVLPTYIPTLAPQKERLQSTLIEKQGLVHRLDQTTSGVLLIAKTLSALQFFQSQWEKVEKIYYAVVKGTPPAQGIIESAIERDPTHGIRMKATQNPQERWAKTAFQVVARKKDYALLKVRIYTGRTHQIRVHLSSIGFPIAGDTLYRGPKSNRIFLHAYSLTFPLPEAPEERKKVVDPLPSEFFQTFPFIHEAFSH